MPKEKISLNSIYISDRLQKSLQPVSNSALTAITAPMGYGKTTAVKVCKMHFPSQDLTFWKITTARKMKLPLDF